MTLREAKAGARKAYLEYLSVLDEYGCGAHLAEYISPRASDAKLRCNRFLAWCRELDPNCKVKDL